jgi:hypothetical protein
MSFRKLDGLLALLIGIEASFPIPVTHAISSFYGAVNFFCNLPACFFQEEVNET